MYGGKRGMLSSFIRRAIFLQIDLEREPFVSTMEVPVFTEEFLDMNKGIVGLGCLLGSLSATIVVKITFF
jgi:hypothetical protein